MTAPLRAAVIGLGLMGRHHARILRDLDGVHLVAAADPAGDPHRAAPDIPVYQDLEQLLSLRLDYCVLATPASQHHPLGLRLAEAQLPTLIEKPLATNSHDAHALHEAFTTRGLVAAVGHIERFNPATQALREHLQAGQLGAIHQIATRRTGPYPTRISDIGVVLDLATHDIDLVTHTTGQNYTHITAHTATRTRHGHEDILAAIGQLQSGTVTNHLVNWLSPLKERLIVVTGEHGCLAADTLHGDLTYYANGTTTNHRPAAQLFRGITEGDVIRYAQTRREPLLAEHEAFRDTILGKTTPIATLNEATETIAIAESILASATTPTARHLPTQATAPARR